MIERIYPAVYRKELEKIIDYSGASVDVNLVIRIQFILSLIFSIISLLLPYSFLVKLLLVIASFSAFHVFFYVFFFLQAESRKNFAEQILPEVLLMVSSNLKAGMSVDKALLASARKEFGILSRQIRRAVDKLLLGESITTALKEIPKGIKSDVIRKTIDLVIEGVQSGGELATLLEEVSEDIRNKNMLKKEVSSQVRLYTLFIAIASCLGAPLLYAVSLHLVETMIKVWSNVEINESLLTTSFFKISKPNINEKSLFVVFIVNIVVTSVFSSLMIGAIEKGKESAGIKYIPLLASISLILFFLVKKLVASVLQIVF